jgi:hypothetical protein
MLTLGGCESRHGTMTARLWEQQLLLLPPLRQLCLPLH